MEMAGSSNTLDVSAPTQDLKLMLASNINVSSFVSVKLSGIRNYLNWSAQMVFLLDSQQLLHIIRDNRIFPQDIPYDRLVKCWILGSVNETVLKEIVDLKTARDIWRKLESLFKEAITINGDSLKLPSIMLTDRNNYKNWKDEMSSLLERKGLRAIIDAKFYPPLDKYHDSIFSDYDKLVKNRIDCTISPTLRVENFLNEDSALYVWMKLESFFDPTKGDAGREDLIYIQASNVNVSNFVTVKLFGPENYKMWKAQILGLIRSQGLVHIISAECPVMWNKDVPMITQCDELVKGWILGSVTEKVLMDLLGMITARGVWRKLESRFSPPEIDNKTEDLVGFKFEMKVLKDVPEIENKDTDIRREKLYKAAIEGCWWKAKSILKIHPKAAIEAITENRNTILHIAVEMGHNYFVEELLEFLKDGDEIEAKNDKGQTALHIAIMVSNEFAAQLLVQKRKKMLEILDSKGKSPLDVSFNNMKLNICAKLFNCALDEMGYDETAILAAIYIKQYDLALKFVEKYNRGVDFLHNMLMAITISFPNDLSSTESIIYPSFHNVRRNTVERCSLLFHSNILDKCVDDILRVEKICSKTWCSWLGKKSMILLVPIATLYTMYQLTCLLVLVLRLTVSMLYFFLWKTLAVTVRPIKNIENKKKMYDDAKKVLRWICEEIDSDPSFEEDYIDPLFEATRQGTYEVVDEILFRAPQAINLKNEEGFSIIQLAIIHRSERVYNLIHHIIERKQSYRIMTDSSGNNLVHLAGKLAPSSVLDRTTGAALQLQRELLWHQELEKLMLPIELIQKKNIYNETPTMVFTREHLDLMKEGENWMKTTAKSCSITAALIVTVVFAAAITVPGGSNQDSGIPVFKKEIAFTVFAISNAFSLFTAATSLLLFLSILTARFSEKDFLLSLPRRLIFGLGTLFLSTTAMIVAFGAILFLVFCDQRPWMLAPISGFACLPILVIVTIKLPLLVDLIQSTYFPIFGEQSYLDSCRTNRKNTFFTE